MLRTVSLALRKRCLCILGTVALALLYSAGVAKATVLQVPENYATIAAAMSAAQSGDEVSVAAGTYNEHSISLKDGVKLRSRSGPASTVIDAGQQGRVLIASAVGSATEVSGFTIRGGRADHGGGIRCYQASPLIENNIIIQNYGSGNYGGGGIFCTNNSDPLIRYNIIAENTSQWGSAGIYVYDNTDNPTIEWNTVAFNTTTNTNVGGGIYLRGQYVTLSNNIVCFNNGRGVARGGGPGAVIRCNDVYGNTVSNYYGMPDQTGINGNISEDPRFCGQDHGDFALEDDSPCSAGDNAQCGQIGAHGVGCGVAPATSVTVVSWQVQDNDGSLLTPGDHAILHLGFMVTGQPTGPGFEITLDGTNTGYNFTTTFDGLSSKTYQCPNWRVGPNELVVPIRLLFTAGFLPNEEIPNLAPFAVRYNPGDGGETWPETVDLTVSAQNFPSLQRPSGITGDLRTRDCLRKVSLGVWNFAQWAEATYGLEFDVDTRLGAAQCAERAIEPNFHFKSKEDATGQRKYDSTHLTHYADQNPTVPIGNCVDFADLSSGVLRALGLQTRDVVGYSRRYAAHQWLEVQREGGPDPDSSSLWVPYDATTGAARAGGNRDKVLEQFGGRAPSQVRAGNWNLPSAHRKVVLWGLANDCDDACEDEFPSCQECVQNWWIFEPFGGPCQQDITDWYGREAQAQGRDESIEIVLVAPANVDVGEPFQARCEVRNVGTAAIDSLSVDLQLREFATDSIGIWTTPQPERLVLDLQPDSAALIIWDVTAIRGEEVHYLVAAAFGSGELPAGMGAVLQSMNNPGTLPNLHAYGQVGVGGVATGSDLDFEASVLDGTLSPFPTAQVTAHVYDSVGGQELWVVPLVWEATGTVYAGALHVPGDAQAGDYYVTFGAEAPGYDVFGSEAAFDVYADLAVGLETQPTTWAVGDTIHLNCEVTDRGVPCPNATVSVTGNTPLGTWSVGLGGVGGSAYRAQTTLRSIASLLGTSVLPSGEWSVRVSASGGGDVAVDSLGVVVNVPDLAAVACTVDSAGGVFHASCTVQNQGTASSDFCLVRFYRDAPDSVGGQAIGEPQNLFALMAGEDRVLGVTFESADVPGAVFAVLDREGVVLEERRDNNLGTWLNPASSVGGEERDRLPIGVKMGPIIPNPSNGSVTIAYSVSVAGAVDVGIYNVGGGLVTSSRLDAPTPGRYLRTLSCVDKRGDKLACGIYFVRLRAGRWGDVKRMVVLQ